MSDANVAGDRFEREVTNVYRMLGYAVTSNVSFEGFQIDLFATRRQPGAGETRLMIECKYKSVGTVSNEELSKLSNTFTEAGRQGGCHKAVMVTNAGFSAAAKAFAANRPHLVLTTLKELEEESFDLYAAYGRAKREYQGQAIHALYVPLKGQGTLPCQSKVTEAFPDLEAALIRWINTGEHGFLTVMADFGAGKTTLLERIKYHYSDLYERSQSRVKPLLFRAKDLHKFSNISDYVMSTVAAEFKSVSDSGLVWRMIGDGAFLLLIDGFDEVAHQVDLKTRRTYLAALSALFNTPSHTIMTCRPTFFIGSEEYDSLIAEVLEDEHTKLERPASRELQVDRSAAVQRMTTDLIRSQQSRRNLAPIRALNVGRIELLPFSPEQIDAYLARRNEEFQKALGVDWNAVKDFLIAVYDIRDLMTRPILLDMIVRTVLSGEIDVLDKTQRIGAAEIYEAYIRALLHRETDDRETRRMVSPRLRQAWIERVALAMYTGDTLELTLREVVDLVERERAAIEAPGGEMACALDDEHLAADVVLTGFLMRDETGTYRFLHKSFLEYLVARHVATAILADAFEDTVGSRGLPTDILYFLGSFLVNDRELFKAMTTRLRLAHGPDDWASNIAGAIVSSGVPQEDFELRSMLVASAVAASLSWRSADLEDVRFAVKSLRSLQFEQCVLLRVAIESPADALTLQHCRLDITIGADVSTLTFEACNGKAALQANVVASKVSASESTLGVDGKGRCGELFVAGGSIEVAAEVQVDRLSVSDATDCRLDAFAFELVDLSRSRVTLNREPRPTGAGRFTATDCDIVMPAYADGPAGKLANADFLRCRVAGLRMNAAHISLLRECRGIVLLDDTERWEKLTGWRKEGDLVFVRRSAFLDFSEGGVLEAIAILQRVAEMFPEPLFLDWITRTREQFEERRPLKPDDTTH